VCSLKKWATLATSLKGEYFGFYNETVKTKFTKPELYFNAIMVFLLEMFKTVSILITLFFILFIVYKSHTSF